ncbi:homeobox KN domain-containing protein [Lipomyces kononenkoae]|uniref:Homeobox KN domain-containing protein n=1 Tax=Lipomyces kononenkoae TaxID=34357 RepID=A0ACC3T1U5_LIPKO
MSIATVSPTTQLPSLQEVLPEFLSQRSSESPSHLPTTRSAYAYEYEAAAAGNASPVAYAESTASSEGTYRGASLSPQESLYGYSLSSGSIPQKSVSVSSASSASSVSSGMSPIDYQPRSSMFYSGSSVSSAEDYQQYQARFKEMYGPKRNSVGGYSPPPPPPFAPAGYYTPAASYAAPDSAYLQAAAFGPASSADLIQKQRQQQQQQQQQQLSVRSVPERHNNGHHSQPSAHVQKKRRGNLPKHVTDILRNWLNAHVQHPYPTEEEKTLFMQQTGLTMNQISNWFINARRRRLPTLNKEAAAAAVAAVPGSIPQQSLSAGDKLAVVAPSYA